MFMKDVEQPMLSFYVIIFETFRKIIEQTEKEGSFKKHISYHPYSCVGSVGNQARPLLMH